MATCNAYSFLDLLGRSPASNNLVNAPGLVTDNGVVSQG